MIGDRDAEGKPDLAGAVHRGETTTAAQSQIYIGDGDRRFRTGPGGVTIHGARYPVTIPGRDGGIDRVVLCNSLEGTPGVAIPF